MYTLRINTRDSKLIIRKTTAKIKVGASVKRGLKGEQGPPGNDGVIQSIVAGDNITVDNADPANPIVSGSSGGGGGGRTLVAETVSTADGAFNMDISGLDLDGDVQYEVEIFAQATVGTIANADITFNNNTTGTNYVTKGIFTNTATVTPLGTLQPSFSIGNSNVASIKFTVRKMLTGSRVYYEGVSQGSERTHMFWGYFSQANVTRITFNHWLDCKAGSYMRIYK